MNKLKRTLALMAALAMTATAFVGCGGNESSSSSESKAESSAEESSEAEGEESSEEAEESSVESAAGYTNVDVPALGEPDGTLKDDDDTLSILCWTDTDLKAMFDVTSAKNPTYVNVGSSGSEANEQYVQ